MLIPLNVFLFFESLFRGARDMKKRLSLIALCASLCAVIGCGDDASSAPSQDDVIESSSSEEVSSSSKQVKSSSSIQAKSSSSVDSIISSSFQKDKSSSSEQAKSSSSSQAVSSSSEQAKSSSSDQIESSSGEKDVSSSSEEDASSSSEVVESSSAEFLTFDGDSLIKPVGYYEHNCPQGIECKSVSTEYLNKEKLTDGSYGEYLDTRDGQVYKVVRIQKYFNENDVIDQVWFAQNLNYAYIGPTASMDSSSFCFNGVADSCARFGRLYLWSAAMDSAGIISGTANQCGNAKVGQYNDVVCPARGEGFVQGVCPDGFHLPTRDDINGLYRATGGYYNAGKNNRIRSLWHLGAYTESDGLDVYGLSILPSGYRLEEREAYTDYPTAAYFWSSDFSKGSVYTIQVKNRLEESSEILTMQGFSVRCVRDY